MTQNSVIRKDGISEFCHANGSEVRPYFGTSFKEGDKVKVHHFGGSVDVGVGLIGEANFRDRNPLTGHYEVWGLSGVNTYAFPESEPVPSKTWSPEQKLARIRDYSKYQTTILRNPYTVEAMDTYVAWTPGDRIYPYGNIANYCYALSKCRKNAYVPYPGLWTPNLVQAL